MSDLFLDEPGVHALLDQVGDVGPAERVEVDISRLSGQDSIDSEEYQSALREYGDGVTVLTGPTLDADQCSSPLRVQLRPHRFYCVRESGESGRDEIYWTLSSGSDTGDSYTKTTGEYGSTSTGTWHEFVHWPGFPPPFGEAMTTYLFNGHVREHLSTNIQCWEADHSPGGWYEKLTAALFDIAEYAIECSSAMSDIEDPDGDAASWAALLGLVFALLGWLLSLFINEDDLVCERSLGFTRSALIALKNRPDSEDWWMFDGGGGGGGGARNEALPRGRRGRTPAGPRAAADG
ncbi:hypothetical protein, partial [Streptomyces sp. NPDC017086]|uniref:hypothetical protein n=1 Tax=Streptomyces sp. NPDC017086 TaxID=3364976 RepID=UPI003792D2B3